MALQVGLVGLPNVGKSTLFNAVSKAGALAANFPFATIDPNIGVVAVPDPRLDRLGELNNSVKVVPTSIEFVDIAGLVAGASTGEGLGNLFLGHIREVDAICNVVRCFEDDDIIHVDGRIDPASDIEVVMTELILKDLDSVEKRLDKLKRGARTGDKELVAQFEWATGLYDVLAEGNPARGHTVPEPMAGLWRELSLLTAKPMLYAANVAEEDVVDGNAHVEVVRRIAEEQGAEVVIISAQVEAEMAELSDADRADFLEALGVTEGGLERLIAHAYSLLGLLTFFTSGPTETRAWTVTAGATAPNAAGKIHSDMERGFIKAEVIAYEDYDALGTEAAAREAGKLRTEGKEYLVKDGDVLHIRFNV